MAILIGIDEAGYGPILGPLAVSSAAFMIPDQLLREDLWHLLGSAVSKQKKSLRGRILITDSKKAYNRKAGLGHLERTSLAMLKVLGFSPANLAELLSLLTPDTVSRLRKYPWYKTIEDTKIDSDKSDIRIAANAFIAASQSKGVSLVGINSELLDVGKYNDMVGKVNNKSSVLFTAVCRHIDWAFKHFGNQNLQIVVDRQGGRSHYLQALTRMFPNAQGSILRESENDCSYEITDQNGKMRVHFVVKADDKFLPVSLASIVSKYIRELLVGRINDYFLEIDQTLKPTAGYWTDGCRFLSDIDKILENNNIDKNLLIRIK